MNNLISVIIPVYNVEIYLERCLNSIVNQTYKNLEIILIDDGSTDNSGNICDEYAKKDNRITVIHKKNGGVSSARNQGLEVAKGDYIGFVDSDDYIEKNMYEVLYKNLVKFDVDISMCNYYIIRNNKKTFHKHDIETGLLIDKKREFFELLRLSYYEGFLWNKLFKTEMIKKFKLEENIYVCEDLLLVSQIVKNCKTFYFDNDCYYNYVIRKGSAITEKINAKKFSALEAYKNIIDIIREYGEDVAIKYEMDFLKWKNDLFRQSKEKDPKLKMESDLLYKKIMKSPYITNIEKMEIFFRYRMYRIYDIIRKIYHIFT